MTVQEAIATMRNVHHLDISDEQAAKAVKTLMETETAFFTMRKWDVWYVASWLYDKYKKYDT